MLSFKDLQEVLQPKAAGEKRFKDKHVADTIDYPLNDAEINKGTKKSPAKKKRIADSEEGKDAAVYEENDDEMTPAQEKKREEIVMAMKKDKEKLQSRYGESWKAVMYATATKQAMSEEVELEEALNPKDKKVVDAFYDGKSMDGKMLSTDGKTLEKTGMGGQTIASKSGNKFKIVAKMDSKSTQDVVKYIEKSFPKNVIESVDLDEALPPHLAKYIGKDGDFTPEVKKRLGKDFMKRMQVPSKKKSNVKDVTPKGYGPNEELDESAAGIAQLKKAYEPLRDKKISLDNAKKLSAIMDKFADDKAMLIKLVKADIPFVSSKAVTILITKHNMKGAEINKMMKEGNAFGMALKAAKEKGDKTFVVAGVTYEVYESADLDEAPRRPKAPKIKFDDIMNRKKKPKTYQVDIDGSRATVTAASEKMAIQKAMTKLKINKKIKPLPKATVKVMEEVGLDEALNVEVGAKVKMGKNYGEVIGIEKVMGKPGLEIKWNDGTKGRFPMSSLAGLSMDRKANYKIDEEVDLDEAFKINPVNVKLNDGSMVKISKDDASALNGLYNSLNPANAKTMIKKMMQDKKSYGEILAFAKQAM
tara:strand:- start:9916 stop:11679 length:1764 start_codon:yes stop_codon:yes gene_type:complete